MKRLPLATLLGVLCFVVLSTVTLHRVVADNTQSNQQTVRSNKTIVNPDGTVMVETNTRKVLMEGIPF